MARAGAFATIRTEGGLLPSDLLAQLAAGALPGMSPETDYHLVVRERLNEAITRSWNRVLAAWTTFSAVRERLPAGEAGTAETRERWLLPLFSELGYGRLVASRSVEVGGRGFAVSHAWGSVPIHLVGAGVHLDRRTPGVAGAARINPHGLVQELLNLSADRDRLWGFVSNGLQLRLLRKNAAITRQAYLEFDLEDMMDGEVYSDFAVLWLVAHQSRLEGEPPATCWLERWSQLAIEQGIRALDRLRDGVEAAISALGRGFLAEPSNQPLRTGLQSGQLDRQAYYRQLLRLVYRMIFLMVAEDRDLLHPPDTPNHVRKVYADHYSVSRLRRLAERRRGSPHTDLYQALSVVMGALDREGGLPTLGLPALGSFLWRDDAIADLVGARLRNRELLEAIAALAFTTDGRLRRAVDYRNLGSEELGSVYESLLELHPELNLLAGTFALATAGGHERRLTGSYYTHTALIAALLDRALDPLLDKAQSATDPASAILSLKVLDPACGSGHFLIAAGHRIAHRLAAARTLETAPSPEAIRHALREVVGKCVYGIDLNPLAVELAKINLWLEAMEPGLPLNFLDHHIVCGNAVVGANPRLIEQGIPDEAFTAIPGDDKPIAAATRVVNGRERAQRNQGLLKLEASALTAAGYLGSAIEKIESEDDATPEGIEEKERRWREFQEDRRTLLAKLAADTWCASFFAPKVEGTPQVTNRTLRSIEADQADQPDSINLVTQLAGHYRFFHPHLGFPQVLQADAEAAAGWRGGFDLVLGNPPWDTLSPDRKEFFSAYEPKIRFGSKTEQDAIVAELVALPDIAQRWGEHQRDLYASVHFMKSSGRYRLFAPGNLGKGDFNVYRMFVETAMQLCRHGGYVAQVVPAIFYSGTNAAAIRSEFFEHWQLDHVLGFINASTDPWFPGVHRGDTRFALYSARKGGETRSIEVAFGIRTAADLVRARQGGTSLPVMDIRQQSPAALTIPEVSGSADAALAARLAVRFPGLGDEEAGLPVRHYQRELDMGTDRGLFGDADGLPVYEGRMVGQFDHRAKAYRSGRGRAAIWEELPFGSPDKGIVPQWRLPAENLPAKLGDRVWRYRVGWCDVAQPETERTLLAALIPPGAICGHKVPTLAFPKDWEWAYMPWLAIANSFCLDYLARKKVALTMSMTVLDSLPFPRLTLSDPFATRLGGLAMRLTCTAPEMTCYWNRLAEYGWCEAVPEGSTPPGLVDPEGRAAARAEIDAVVARDVFDLSADELATIVDTFPVLRRREEKLYGEFRTKRLVLEQYARE